MEIYRILNKKNNKSYIGATKWTIKERYSQGKWWKWTHSFHLKRAVERYGLENFEVQILERDIETEKELYEKEKEYIEKFNSFVPNGYNLTWGGGSENPSTVKEYELIDYNGNIYRIINLSQFCRKNKLNYGAMLNMVSNINTSSQGFALSTTPIEKIENPNKTYNIVNVITDKKMSLHKNDIESWCVKNSLNTENIKTMLFGGSKISQNWKLEKTIINNQRIENLKKYGNSGIQKFKDIKLKNPQGEIVTIDNIYQFCKENPYYYRTGFYNLINGKSLTYEGWSLPISKEELREKFELRLGKKITVKRILDNKLIEIKNISKFCRENNLNINTFFSMLRGVIQQYNGYCLPETNLTNYKPPKKIVYIKMLDDNGQTIEGKNPKEIENKTRKITSQTIQDFINKKNKNCKSWKLLKVKYLNNYYPEINNENK